MSNSDVFFTIIAIIFTRNLKQNSRQEVPLIPAVFIIFTAADS